MRLLITILFLIIFSNKAFSLNHSRKVQTVGDEISDVKTALGIATLIQFNEPLSQSPITGDQSAFRIETIENGYSIKPLRWGAKTNLFINTKERRYTVRLTTGSQNQADYVVYLQTRKNKNKFSVSWRPFKRKVKASGLTLETQRIGKTNDGFLIFDFLLKAQTQKSIDLNWFFLTQGKDIKTIHSLVLSSRDIENEKPVTGLVAIALDDLNTNIPATFEIKILEKLSLEISREFIWKK